MNVANTVAWEGRFGDADLKIEIPPSGRIHAEWRTNAGVRNKVVDSIEQLERGVLFQLMIGAQVQDVVRDQVADAVALSLANHRPSFGRDPSLPAKSPRKKNNARPGARRPGAWQRPRRRR